MPARIMIVDDDSTQRRYLSAALRDAGYAPVCAESGQAALDQLRDIPIDLMLLDLAMPGMDGLEVLRQLRAGGGASGGALAVIVLTADSSTARAVEAMRAGATDFLVKPAGPERLDVSIRNALALSDLSTELGRLVRADENRLGFDDLIAAAPATRKAIALARRAAQSDIPVLIEGESGTGKEVFARAIHGSSDRAGGPFIVVSCGALPATLADSILFGHEKGSFTRATSHCPGRIREADGGTLFLDEVDDLPPAAQAKLLRAIQTGEVDPVGAAQPVRVDIRLISATNRDLSGMAAGGEFRADLFYRLGVFPLRLPPLRDRREDLPGLARMFVKRFAAAERSEVEGFARPALEAMADAPWPGNVRQLESAIHRAVVMAEGAVIRPEDLLGSDGHAMAMAARRCAVPVQGIGHDPFLREDGHVRRLLDVETEAIRRALSVYRGRMSETARRLGIGRSTLYRKLDELRIEKPAE